MALPSSFFKDSTSGQGLLERFIAAVDLGHSPDNGDLIALAEMFKQILKGTNAKKALGISGRQSQGRPGKSARDLDADISLVKNIYKKVSPKRKLLALQKEAAENAGVSLKTIQNKCREHKLHAEFLLCIEQTVKKHERLRSENGEHFDALPWSLKGINELSAMFENASVSQTVDLQRAIESKAKEAQKGK